MVLLSLGDVDGSCGLGLACMVVIFISEAHYFQRVNVLSMQKARHAGGLFVSSATLSVIIRQLLQDGWVFQCRGVLRDGFVFCE